MKFSIEKLEELTEKEIEYIVRNGNYIDELNVFKKNNRKYAQYMSMLGNLRSNSPMVKHYLPGIIAKLFKKKDQNFIGAVQRMADYQAQQLISRISDAVGKEVNPKDIQEFTAETFADIITSIYVGGININQIDFDLLWVQLKLNDINFSQEKRKKILMLCGKNDVTSSDEENAISHNKTNDTVIEETNQNDNIYKRKNKVKKLTPKEKEEKYRLAILKKEAEAKEILANERKENETSIVVNIEDKQDLEMSDPSISSLDSTDEQNINIEEMKMNYICKIDIIGDFYNVTPIGTYNGHNYNPLSENDVIKLLPKSTKNNINFSYRMYDRNTAEFMRKKFHNDGLVVLDYDITKLELNKKNDGTINETGYKINAIEGWNTGKIKFLSDVGLFRLISKDDLEGDILVQRTIMLNGEYVEGESVLVNSGDGFYAGPFKVNYSEDSSFFYIVTRPNKDHMYLNGYNYSGCTRVIVETMYDSWISGYSENYYYINNEDDIIYRDIITDKDLITAFAGALDINSLSDIKIDEIDETIDSINNSQIFGKDIPATIRSGRLKVLKSIFESEEKLDDLVYETSEIVYKLLLRNKNDKSTNELLSRMMEDHPEFMDRIQGVRVVQARIESAKQELEVIEAKKATEEKEEKENREIAALSKISDEIREKEKQLEQISKRLEEVENLEKLISKVDSLNEQEKYLQTHVEKLKDDSKGIEQNFVTLINRYSERMADITFDGFMSSKMLQSAALWEKDHENDKLNDLVQSLNSSDDTVLNKEQLIDYIVTTIKKARPKYDYNTIINIATCCTQGFLTVFSGAPGCGKTSICNIFARVLGLRDYGDINPKLKGISRFIPVSVERGWTSKRDFVGYFNPLTKTFEENNRDVFNGLKLLNEEKNSNSSKYPFFILLDEANLSPMEYYWADFMNVCDDRDDSSFINLGNDNVFYIPETLHFLATINNDHTTETLSPRLIDRAWVITLPKNNSYIKNDVILDDEIQHISWTNLKSVFLNIDSKMDYDREAAGVLEGLKEKLSKQSIYLSPRVNMAMIDYWRVASVLMKEDEYGNHPTIIALDYAISQKVLPKIIGSGENFGDWLKDLKDYCSGKNLMRSAEILEGMIRRGSMRMKYFDFFN